MPAAGYDLRTIRVEGLSRTNPLKAARAVRQAVAGGRAARRILRDVRPDAVLGGGGYVAGPVGLAAVARRIPLVLTEADSHLGLVEPVARAASPAASASRSRSRAATGERYLVTGRPVPPPATDSPPPARASASATASAACSSSAGRSGARSINEAAVDGLRAPPPATACCTPAGTRDFDGAARRASPPAARYDLRPYIDDFGEALAAGDLCVARAGGSIFEIAAHGRAGDPRPVPARDGRPPDGERALDGRRRRGGGDRPTRSSRRSACAPRSARCWPTLRACRRWRRPPRALARPDAAQRIARSAGLHLRVGAPSGAERRASSRGPGAGCTSSASAAPG